MTTPLIFYECLCYYIRVVLDLDHRQIFSNFTCKTFAVRVLTFGNEENWMSWKHSFCKSWSRTVEGCWNYCMQKQRAESHIFLCVCLFRQKITKFYHISIGPSLVVWQKKLCQKISNVTVLGSQGGYFSNAATVYGFLFCQNDAWHWESQWALIDSSL